MLVRKCTKGKLPRDINFGCGSDVKAGWLNIDQIIPTSPLLDVVHPDGTWIMEGEWNHPSDLPKNYFRIIQCTMVMEHLHPDDIPNQLYCFANAMEPEGRLIITVPNFYKLAAKLCALEGKEMWNLHDYLSFREITNEFMYPNRGGAQGHQSIWLKHSAYMWLHAEGFKMIKFEEVGEWHVEIWADYIGGEHVECVT